MPRPRFDKLPADKQRRILDAAVRHFAADGYENASLNQILEEAGVSKGAAYYYFDGKGDLFATAVERAWDDVIALLWPEGDFDPTSLIGPWFWDEVEALYLRQMELFQADPDPWRMAKALPAALHDPSAARLAPRFEAFMGLLLQWIEQGRAAGYIRDDLPIALQMQMLSGLDDAIDTWLLDHPDELRNDPTLAPRAFAALRRLLEPTPNS